MTKKKLVDADDLVAIGDIANRFNVQRNTANRWTQRRTTNHFPEPVARTSAGDIYLWSEIEQWGANKKVVLVAR